MTTNPTRTAVEATAKELRERGTEINPVNVADMLDALLVRAENAEAERDDARVGEKFWREHCDEVCENSRDGNAALTEIDECWLATGMMTNRALLSLSEQISALQCEHESELAAARETIARLTTEVQAARDRESKGVENMRIHSIQNLLGWN